MNNYAPTLETMFELGTIYTEINNLDAAKNMFQEAFLLIQEKKIPKQFMYYFQLLNYSGLLIKLNNFTEAQKQLNIVKTYAKTNAFDLWMPLLLIKQAEILAHQNKTKEAQELLTRINQTNLILEIKLEYFKTLTAIYKKNKDFKQALASNEAYFLVKDSMQNTKLKNSINYNNTKFESDKKEQENLQLKAAKAAQQVVIEKEKRKKWQLGFGLGASLLIIIIGGYFYTKNRKQKLVIENLQKELHHRIKNNLAIIDTFIEVAKEEFKDVAFTNKLTELQNRVASINQVHQQLYNSKHITDLSVKKYVATLAATIQQSVAAKNVTITQHINNNLTLNAEKSFSVGLIINEFLTNSFKYAFGENAGTILIEMEDAGAAYKLLLSDNGKGLPLDFNLQKTETFGLRVIKLLTEQLNGTFKLNGTNGVQLIIQFPK